MQCVQLLFTCRVSLSTKPLQGFLVEFGTSSDTETPIRILFDPFLSERAGPSQWTSIPRRLPAPCSVEELPDVHYVLISHNQCVYSEVYFNEKTEIYAPLAVMII